MSGRTKRGSSGGNGREEPQLRQNGGEGTRPEREKEGEKRLAGGRKDDEKKDGTLLQNPAIFYDP